MGPADPEPPASLPRAYATLYNCSLMLNGARGLCREAKGMGLKVDEEKALGLYLFGDSGKDGKN